MAITALTTISGEIQAQPLNDNFSHIAEEFNTYLSNNAYSAKNEGLLTDGTNIYTALNTLLTTISSNEREIHFSSGTYTLGTNITIPSNVRLKFANGAMISMAAGIILTIEGKISYTTGQIFTGDGTVNLNDAKISHARPEWWGAKADDTTNSTAAIVKAHTAFKYLEWQNGVYLTDPINVSGWAYNWIGSTGNADHTSNGYNHTVIRARGTQTHVLKGDMRHSFFENICFDGDNTTDDVLYITSPSTGNKFEKCFIINAVSTIDGNGGGKVIRLDGGVSQCDRNTFKNCYIYGYYGNDVYYSEYAIYSNGSNTFLNVFDNCFISNAKLISSCVSGSGVQFINNTQFEDWTFAAHYIPDLVQEYKIEDCYTETEALFLSQIASISTSKAQIIIRNNKLNAIDTQINFQLQQPIIFEGNALSATVFVYDTAVSNQYYIQSSNNQFASTFGFTGTGLSKVYSIGDRSGTGYLTNFLDNLQIGLGGSKITKHLTVTGALNFSASSSVPGSVDLTIAATGAALGDTVTVGSPVTVGADYILTAFVSAANVVTVRWTQIAGVGADPDGAGGTYRVDVWKH